SRGLATPGVVVSPPPLSTPLAPPLPASLLALRLLLPASPPPLLRPPSLAPLLLLRSVSASASPRSALFSWRGRSARDSADASSAGRDGAASAGSVSRYGLSS